MKAQGVLSGVLPYERNGAAAGLRVDSSRATWGAPVFVWGFWAVLLVAALAFFWRYRSNVPIYDDWELLVPPLTGQQPITLAWLWAPEADHRMPLVKLTLLVLANLPYYEIRAASFFNVLLSGGLAFTLIMAARNIRGWTSYSDAFLPLVLLNLGQFGFFPATSNTDLILVGGLLLIIIRNHSPLTFKTAAAAGLCVLLLPLCGASGVVVVPAFALWLGCVGAWHWRSSEINARRNSLLILSLASAALLMLPLYLVGYNRFGFETYQPPSLRAWLRTSVQFLSMSFGGQAADSWPISGLGILALFLITIVALLWLWRTQPQERWRCLGLFFFLGAMISLALAVGFGRMQRGYGAGLELYYATLAVPALFSIYFMWEIAAIYHPGISRFVQMTLLSLMLVLLPLNTEKILSIGNYYGEHMDAFERDLLAGKPPSLLAERYSPVFLPDSLLPSSNGEKEVFARVRALHRAGIGKFRFLQEDPVYEQVSLPVAPASVNQAIWDNGTAHGVGNDSYLIFDLQKPRFVYAIRFTHSYGTVAAGSGRAFFQMFWKRSDEVGFSRSEQLPLHIHDVRDDKKPGQKIVTIWVNDTIEQFRIHPDNKPSVFNISKIVLLTPATELPPS